MTRNTPRVRVYIATSLDGFIAGEDDDLSWLPSPDPGEPLPPGALDWEGFMAGVGAVLMGRRTYDVVRGFDVDWPFPSRPVLVATHRSLDAGAPEGVERVEGPVEELVAAAKEAARSSGVRGCDVYLDGGQLIRQACAVGLVDELVVTLAPVAIGSGRSLFRGLEGPLGMRVEGVSRFPGGMVQLRLVPDPR